jgi:hypothetical protein
MGETQRSKLELVKKQFPIIFSRACGEAARPRKNNELVFLYSPLDLRNYLNGGEVASSLILLGVHLDGVHLERLKAVKAAYTMCLRN